MSANENDWSPELEPRQRAFLEAFSRLGTVLSAAEGICGRASHYRWMEESEVYAANFALARKLFGQALLDVAMFRAIHGVEEPVRYKGRPVQDADGKIPLIYQGQPCLSNRDGALLYATRNNNVPLLLTLLKAHVRIPLQAKLRKPSRGRSRQSKTGNGVQSVTV